MSEQQQETPVWHAIVGEGWEPVQFGEAVKAGDQELLAIGWVVQYDSGCTYDWNMRPRRRRKRLYDVVTTRAGVTLFRIKAAKPGDRFMLAQNGELVPIEVDE